MFPNKSCVRQTVFSTVLHQIYTQILMGFEGSVKVIFNMINPFVRLDFYNHVLKCFQLRHPMSLQFIYPLIGIFNIPNSFSYYLSHLNWDLFNSFNHTKNCGWQVITIPIVAQSERHSFSSIWRLHLYLDFQNSACVSKYIANGSNDIIQLLGRIIPWKAEGDSWSEAVGTAEHNFNASRRRHVACCSVVTRSVIHNCLVSLGVLQTFWFTTPADTYFEKNLTEICKTYLKM